MIHRGVLAVALCLTIAGPAWAQLSQDARFEIIRIVLAEQAAARIALPFGGEGVELTDTGIVNQQKLATEIEKNGQSVQMGKVVAITDIQFDDKSIEIEVDGGGKNKRGILERIQVGIGGGGSGGIERPVGSTDEQLAKAKGSKVVLRFANRISPTLTPDELKQLLDPVLDFNKQNFMKTGIDSLPPEFREAVLAKEARIGMDRNTVLMALGRPHNKWREKGPDGLMYEDWIYQLRGFHSIYVKFNEEYIVVSVKQF